MHHDFVDLLEANERYVSSFGLAGLSPVAAKGLAIVTCMDTRIEPLAMLGLVPGDAKIVRNAGARVTEDVLRTLVLAVNTLGVERIALIGHTQCKMTTVTESEVAALLETRYPGRGADAWWWGTVADQVATLEADLQLLVRCPLLPDTLGAAAFVYDVDTGRLHAV